MAKVKITRNSIIVDGHELAHRCLGYRLEQDGIDRPQLHLTILVDGLEVETEDVDVTIRKESAESPNC